MDSLYSGCFQAVLVYCLADYGERLLSVCVYSPPPAYASFGLYEIFLSLFQCYFCLSLAFMNYQDQSYLSKKKKNQDQSQ